jgi:hypothetical protein
MTKREIIMNIRAAKAAHVRWKSFVQIALRGIITESSKADIPIVQTECDFGKWYYGDGMALSMLTNFAALEEPHEMVHEMYIQIYTLQKAKLRGGFFTNTRKLLKRRQQEIGALMANLNDYTKILLGTLHQLEIEVLNMNDDEIKDLFDMNTIPPIT